VSGPVKTLAIFALLCSALWPLVALTKDVSVWAVWERDLHRTCPSHHVEWVFGDGYDELLYAFEKTLPDKTRMLVKQVADLQHRCAAEKCEEPASCSRFPRETPAPDGR